MRTLKFRAWDGKEMKQIQDYPNLLIEEKGKWFVMDGNKLFCNYLTGQLMQSTGFKDKNGVEIYEGDITKCKIFYKEESTWGNDFGTKAEIGYIKYDKTAFKFFHKQSYVYPIFLEETSSGSEERFELEIIGNIYENPELLIV